MNVPLAVHLAFYNGIFQTQRSIYLQIGIGQSIRQTISPSHDDYFQPKKKGKNRSFLCGSDKKETKEDSMKVHIAKISSLLYIG